VERNEQGDDGGVEEIGAEALGNTGRSGEDVA